MVEPRFRWTFPDAVTPSPDRPSMPPRRRGISTRMAGLLATRGAVDRPTTIAAWFADPLDGLHDPRLLPDAGPAARAPDAPPATAASGSSSSATSMPTA